MAKHIVIPRGRRGATGISGVDGESGVSILQPRIDLIESVGPLNDIYIGIGADGANDANDGKTSETPIVTMGRLLEICMASTYNRVRIISASVNLTGTHILRKDLTISFEKAPDITSAQINFTGLRMLMLRPSHIRVDDVTLRFTTGQSTDIFNFYANGQFYATSVTFDNGAGGSGSLINNIETGNIYAVFSNSPLDTWAGRIFNGVASGADPNALIQYTSNINSG